MKLSVFIRRVSTKTTMCMIQQTCDTHRTTCIFIILDYLYVYIKKTEKMTSDDIK